MPVLQAYREDVSKKRLSKSAAKRRVSPLVWIRRWLVRLVLLAIFAVVAIVTAHRFVDPPQGIYIRQEAARLGSVTQRWTPAEEIAPVMLRAVVAAEDANFCAHWGFDMAAIREALAEGSGRGASSLSQQVVKNTYLWHGRSWARKALEAVLTPVVEALWTKRRIVEVYVNIAEFDEGVFGVAAAAQHYFGVSPAQLSPLQAARLAAVLPAPKRRSASRPTKFLRKRSAQILDGAETIRRDGRAGCFES